MPPLLFAPPCLAILPLCFSILLLPPSSLAILPLRFSIHLLPPSSLAILPLRFSIHLLPPPSLAILPLRFSMSRGEASPRAAIGICQYASPPSPGAQSPRPPRPGFTHPLPSRPSLRPLFGMLAFSTNEQQHHEETLDNSALFAPSSPLLNWITDRDKCMSSECDGRDAQHPHTQFKYR